MSATPLQPRSTRPIVPNIAGLSASAAASAAAYQHEFRPVTPRVVSGGGSAMNGQQAQQPQQPVAAHYRASSTGGGGIVGSASDPFEKDKHGPISATLAEARA